MIKGVFKDHLVTWVGDYLELMHGEAGASAIMADIDHRYDLTSTSMNLK